MKNEEKEIHSSDENDGQLVFPFMIDATHATQAKGKK